MTAEALILAYQDAVRAAREPLRVCSQERMEDDGTHIDSCYRRWQANADERRRPDPDEPADYDGWCPECLENEQILRRRAAAKRTRGAVLRAMQRYRAKVTA